MLDCSLCLILDGRLQGWGYRSPSQPCSCVLIVDTLFHLCVDMCVCQWLVVQLASLVDVKMCRSQAARHHGKASWPDCCHCNSLSPIAFAWSVLSLLKLGFLLQSQWVCVGGRHSSQNHQPQLHCQYKYHHITTAYHFPFLGYGHKTSVKKQPSKW